MDSEEAKVVDLHNRSRNARYDRLRRLRRYQALLAARPAAGPAPADVVNDEERIVEEVARAIYDEDRVPSCATPWESAAPLVQGAYRRLAVAAITAYRTAQDGWAAEAVRRVSALAEEWLQSPIPIWTDKAAALIRAALAATDD